MWKTLCLSDEHMPNGKAIKGYVTYVLMQFLEVNTFVTMHFNGHTCRRAANYYRL